MQFCQEVYAHNKVAPAIPSWLVMEKRYMDRYMVAGSLPGSKKPQSWFDEGFLVKADTLDELADKCGMDRAILQSSINRFNELARTGEDVDFGRGSTAYHRYWGDPTAGTPNPNMAALEQGPYYAYKFYPGDIGTWGGVLTDSSARVLRDDGSVIPGLYATGTSAASFMGRKYLGPGASVGPSFTWGYVAAKHAMNADNSAA
jgi:3-oxosteroid 1-dehydrogenase